MGEQSLRPEKWVSIRRQEIIFDDAKCLLVSLHDLSERHKVSQQQKQINILKMLHSSVSGDLVDTLSMIGVTASWLIKWHKANAPNDEILAKLYRILVASKMSFFKCNDLLEFANLKSAS